MEAQIGVITGPPPGHDLWVALRSQIQDQEVGPTQVTRTVRVICVGPTFWSQEWVFKVGLLSAALDMDHTAMTPSKQLRRHQRLSDRTGWIMTLL